MNSGTAKQRPFAESPPQHGLRISALSHSSLGLRGPRCSCLRPRWAHPVFACRPVALRVKAIAAPMQPGRR